MTINNLYRTADSVLTHWTMPNRERSLCGLPIPKMESDNPKDHFVPPTEPGDCDGCKAVQACLDSADPTLSLVSLAMAAAYQRGYDQGHAKAHLAHTGREFSRGWQEGYSYGLKQNGGAEPEHSC